MSVKLLSGEEILKVAMNLEEEGLEIYTHFSEIAKNNRAKEVFRKLADYEKEHFLTFSKLHSQIVSSVPLQEPAEIGQELSLYLRGLIDTGVFTTLKTLSKAELAQSSDTEAVSLGIRIEKNSILFFTEVYEANIVLSAKPALSEIIKEERKHLAVLFGLLAELKG